MSYSFAHSNFGLAPAVVVVFNLSLVAYTSDQMATNRVILVVYNLPTLLLPLQNAHSFTSHRRIMLLFSDRHLMRRNWTLSPFHE